jgi:hypothetical protein
MDKYLQFLQAAEARDAVTLARLIQDEPALHACDGEDGSLLDMIRHHCPELFPAAFAAGLSPDSGPDSPHQTLLQRAVCDSELELIRLCLRHGADVERRNNEGETALGYAASWGTLEVVRLLVEAGAAVNAIEGRQEGFYSTALDSTFSSDPASDRPAIRDYLREHGAKRFSELSPTPEE